MSFFDPHTKLEGFSQCCVILTHTKTSTSQRPRPFVTLRENNAYCSWATGRACLWLSPGPSGSSAVGHCHPAVKHALGTGCSSPPAPSLQAQDQVVGAGTQHKDKASSALLLWEQGWRETVPAGRNPPLRVCMGLSLTTELQLHLGRAGKDVLSSHSSSSPTSRGEPQQSQLQKRLMQTESLVWNADCLLQGQDPVSYCPEKSH